MKFQDGGTWTIYFLMFRSELDQIFPNFLEHEEKQHKSRQEPQVIQAPKPCRPNPIQKSSTAGHEAEVPNIICKDSRIRPQQRFKGG